MVDWNDKQAVLLKIEKDGNALYFASEELKNDKELVMAAVKQNVFALEYASTELKNDKEVVMAAMEEDFCALKYASEELKNDKEVVLAAMTQDFYALRYASEELKNDKEAVIAAVKINGHALKYASGELKNDEEVVIAAVEQNGLAALQYASEELKNDKEVVLAAVKINGLALKYASEELKNDEEVVIAAVKQFGHALQYASEELKNDKEIVMAAVKQFGYALQYASEELKNDKEIVMAAVRTIGYVLSCASEELKNDKEIVMAAVEQNGRALKYASEELKNDKEVVLAAVKQNSRALKYASEELKYRLARAKQSGSNYDFKRKQLFSIQSKAKASANRRFSRTGVSLAPGFASEELKKQNLIRSGHAPLSIADVKQYSHAVKCTRGGLKNEEVAVAAVRTYSLNPVRLIQKRTKITNNSTRDIEVVISHDEIEITFSAKGELGIDVCEVAKFGGSISKTTKCPPRKPEMAVIAAGSTERFPLPQKDYYLTIMSSDPSKGVIVHESNRFVLSREDWTFEQKDLSNVLRQSKTVLTNESDRKMIVIVSDCKVSTSAAATIVGQMGVNTSETEDHAAFATQISEILPHKTESFNISEQNFFMTTASEDPELGHILHESNRIIATKDGYSFTQDYLKKNVGSLLPGRKKFWFF